MGAPRTDGGGSILGTVLYMAPEQLREEGRRTPRTDGFASGVVLFEMATGVGAFTGTQPGLADLVDHTADPLDLLDAAAHAGGARPGRPGKHRQRPPADPRQSTHDVELEPREFRRSGSRCVRRRGRQTVAGGHGQHVGAGSRRRRRSWLSSGRCGAFGSRRRVGSLPLIRAEAGDRRWSRGSTADLADGTQSLTRRGREGRDGPAPGCERFRGEIDCWYEVRAVLWPPDGRSIAFFTRDKFKRVEFPAALPSLSATSLPGGGKAGTWGCRTSSVRAIQGARSIVCRFGGSLSLDEGGCRASICGSVGPVSSTASGSSIFARPRRGGA